MSSPWPITALLSTTLKVRVLYITVVMMTLLASMQQGILGSTTLSLPYDVTSGLKNAGVPYILFLGSLHSAPFCSILLPSAASCATSASTTAVPS